MPEPPDEQIVLKGPVATIAYAVDAKGEMPAREFLESTKGKKAPTKDELAGLEQAFRVMALQGKVANKEQFKHERGKIFAFKNFQARVAAFRDGDVWFLTHGFKKKVNSWPPKQLDLADRIREEHLSRAKDRR